MFGLTRLWGTPELGRSLAVGRSLVAAGTLTELVFTPATGLVGSASGIQCGGVSAVSLWCAGAAVTHGLLASQLVSIGVLVLVLSGYRPRWTCVPHWYVTFSLGTSILAANGGDDAAKVATLLLIPLCLGDQRVWQWTRRSRALAPYWAGVAMAAIMAIRLQVAVIYVTAVVSKLADPAWRNGVAMYYVVYDPTYGLPPSARAAIGWFLGSYWLIAALTWLIIAVQLTIAVTVVSGRRLRLIALVLATALHIAIAILLSLPSFALIMIGLVATAYGGPVMLDRHRVAVADEDLAGVGTTDAKE